MTPEGKIKKEIRDWLRKQGAYVFSPVQMGMGAHTLDILVCLYGKFIAIEVKVPNKTPTRRQEACIAEIQRAGGIAFWCTSLEGCQEELWRHGL